MGATLLMCGLGLAAIIVLGVIYNDLASMFKRRK